MADRLRVLLDRPLDPSLGRAVMALAAAIFAGFALVVLLGGLDRGQAGPSADPTPAARPVAGARAVAAPPVDAERPRPASGRRRRRQDPQDRPGSGAARRAATELHAHRALQHVPYRRGDLTIALVGARRGRAVLLVSAPGIGAARRGWRSFLRRYRDDGRAYVPRFRSVGGRGG